VYALVGAATSWDTFALPADCWRSLVNDGPDEALVLVLTAGDHRKHIVWEDATVQAAARAGLAVDANGFVGDKRFVDRAQR
jgi:hypothetical protein